MECEKCHKNIVEGNFILVPCYRQTNRGLEASTVHVVCCDECCKAVPSKIVGSAKIVEGETVPATQGATQ